ncbi:MAG: Lipoprotein signal peptidase [uncultured Sphingosinicella sp.]|uniref:Lipoprotein signal peptidase n=1 Tax=uncultured Sphingosinicella sp. TaxID=478748 RepID=A0A6J4U0B1_9SPHN|nr:signal peptidase II [uncultured Sphingosinicella sp.]CAA9536266.1 MAG: Lipoprotein signal peptidase [uncultured Sphingosinicella sp.]
MADTVAEAPAHSRAAPVERNHRTLAFTLAALVFIFDQLTKYIVTVPLQLQKRGSMELFEIFDLRWVENRGVSMGFLTADSDAGRWLLVLLTAAISFGVFIWIWREKRRDDAIALSLVLGGALGNIVDRMRFGYVVDFADLHFGEWRPFLIFNVADAAITIGVLLLLVRALLTREKKAPRKEV